MSVFSLTAVNRFANTPNPPSAHIPLQPTTSCFSSSLSVSLSLILSFFLFLRLSFCWHGTLFFSHALWTKLISLPERKHLRHEPLADVAFLLIKILFVRPDWNANVLAGLRWLKLESGKWKEREEEEKGKEIFQKKIWSGNGDYGVVQRMNTTQALVSGWLAGIRINLGGRNSKREREKERE